MNEYENKLFALTSYFFEVLIEQFMKCEKYEKSEYQKGVFGKIDYHAIGQNFAAIHPLVLESQQEFSSLPEYPGEYKLLKSSLGDSLNLFMALLEEKIYFLSGLHKKTLGESFPFKDFRRSDKTIKKLHKNMSKQLYSLELRFKLFINQCNKNDLR